MPASVYDVSITSTDGTTTEDLGEITTKSKGQSGMGELVLRSGDPLPLGAASITELAGATISVADSEGTEVLSGIVPSIDNPTVCEDDDDDDGDDDDDDDDDDDNDVPKIKVKAKITRGGDVLSIEVENLEPEMEYDVTITNPDTSDSESLGPITTDMDGEAEIEIETGEGGMLPLGAESVADLVGFEIAIVDGNGDTILTEVVPSPRIVPPKDAEGDGGGASLALEAEFFVFEGAYDTRLFRGDANGDTLVDISDPVFTLSHLFLGGPRPECLDAADSNDDGAVDVSDPVTTLLNLFGGGNVYPEPGQLVQGFDPTPDLLHCE
jgi:hypothetical protein